MALKALLLRRKLEQLRTQMESMNLTTAELESREVELAAALEEAKTEEEIRSMEEMISEFESKKTEHRSAVDALQADINAAEEELRTLEAAQPPVPPASTTPNHNEEERFKMNTSETRAVFFGMNAQQRDVFFAREDVKTFLQRVRELSQEKRAVTGGELLIPDVVLGILREQVAEASKLIKHTYFRAVSGTSRVNIAGTIPEAVWTEMCAKLNELTIAFNALELDGFKVGGFIALCNAQRDDSDPALATEIITALARAIGLAVDKAIAYGTGTKMPLGFVTRLAQTSAPSGYLASARTWADLHTSNIITITAANSTGAKLFQSVLKAAGAAKGKYASGPRFWVMNETTKANILAESIGVNSAGAIVAGMGDTMPILGGVIETLEFIPDKNILMGWDGLYVLVERAGTTIASSEHFRFLDDQTVYKGTARYDGAPAIAEGFAVIGIGGTAPTTSMTFAEDTANADPGEETL